MLAQTASLERSVDLLNQLWKGASGWHIALAIVVALGPGLLALINGQINIWRLRSLYDTRIKDKDGEIERLAAMVKQLQNELLKTKRK